MTIRKTTLTLLALPAILLSGAAEASTCPAFMCGSDSNGPSLTGLQAASSAGQVRQPNARDSTCKVLRCCVFNPFCKLATNGPELTGLQPASGRATVTAIRLPSVREPNSVGTGCPPFACGAESNGPLLTGSRASIGAATVTAIRLPSVREPNEIGGSCPPFACGADSNGPSLTGVALRRFPDLVPPPQPRPVPIPYPNGSRR